MKQIQESAHLPAFIILFGAATVVVGAVMLALRELQQRHLAHSEDGDDKNTVEESEAIQPVDSWTDELTAKPSDQATTAGGKSASDGSCRTAPKIIPDSFSSRFSGT